MVSAPKPCIHFCFPPYMPHASPFSSSVIWSTKEHLMRSMNHEAPHYAVFRYFFLFRPKHRLQDSFLAHHQPVFFPLKWATEFHTYVNPALVWWGIFTALLWWGMTHPMYFLLLMKWLKCGLSLRYEYQYNMDTSWLHRASTMLNPLLLPTDAHNVKKTQSY